MPFSTVIIAKDEEGNLRHSIPPITQICDDVIVVDSGSSDGSREVALEYGCRVIEKEWTGYSDARNYGAKQAKFEWILQIDADEIVGEQLSDSLRRLLLPKTESRAFSLDRITRVGEKWVRHSGWYPDWKTRLYNRNGAEWVGEYVHERLGPREGLNELWVDFLDGRLYHHSYPTIQSVREKSDRYAELAAEKILSEGGRGNRLFVAIRAAARFIRTYLLKLGFMDGRLGFEIALSNARMIWVRGRRVRELRSLRDGA